MKLRWFFLLGVIAANFLIFSENQLGKARMVFCDVGQGDGFIAEYDKFQMVIDVGPNNDKFLSCLNNNLPLGDKEIEVLIVTHMDADHAGSLKKIMKFYKINEIYCGVGENNKNEYKLCTKYIGLGDTLVSKLFTFEILNPDRKAIDLKNDNNNSIVGIFSYNDKNIFFTGDITKEVEDQLVWRNILTSKVTFLKVSHHGSRFATSPEILDVLKPQAAIISVGSKNRYGHPDNQIIQILKERGVEIHRTDQNGDIIFRW